MKILISAAEASSDAHGAELLAALQKHYPSGSDGQEQKLEVFGIGGPKLQAAGLKTVVDARDLLAMGFIEVLKHLPRIFSALSRLTQVVRREVPDVAVVIDYPDFHFRLAKRLSKLGVPVVYYIPPKVWVWRKGRIRFLKKYFVKILSVLPFEEDFYQSQNMSVKYVGSPLVDELPIHRSKGEARDRLALKISDLILIIMPGSRKSELRQHLKVMLEASLDAAIELQKRRKLRPSERLVVLMPLPETAPLEQIKRRVTDWCRWNDSTDPKLDVRVSQGNAGDCLVAADVGLIKSGTSTLEAGMLQCPHALIYKPHLTSAWIFKYLIRYKGPVGLVNLVAGWKPGDTYLVPEILCENVTRETLKKEIIDLLCDDPKRQKMLQGFQSLKKKVCGDTMNLSPSAIAAREILEVATNETFKKNSL